jgi:hypothetical protein
MDGFVAVFFFYPSLEHQSFFFQKHISLWRVWFLLCYVYKGWQKVRKTSRRFFFLGVGFCVSLKLESGYKSWPS